MDDLVIDGTHIIPAQELFERFETSGGPGGQHANRSATRVILTYDLGSSEVFDAATRSRMLDRLGERGRGGTVTVAVDDSRSQWRNRALARRRLADLLVASMQRPTVRRPTRPSRAAMRRRLDTKRERSEVKRLRRRPTGDV